MYAKFSGNQLTNITNGKRITLADGSLVCNPSAATLAREGYYEIPATTGSVESWALIDGALVPTYAPVEQPQPLDTYVRNPETNKYHKMTVLDDGGVLLPQIAVYGSEITQ